MGIARPAAVAQESLGLKGLFAYGLGFGVMAAMVRHVGRSSSSARVPMRAADIEVAEQVETKPISYLENIPRTIIEKRALDKLLTTVPREQWEDPPEDTFLYTLKCFAEVYGEGKATRMGWWDFYYMRQNMIKEEEIYTGKDMAEFDAVVKSLCRGEQPLYIPGPSGFWPTGATIMWRGKEMFAGDQCQTPVTNGRFAVNYLNNLAFYRDGLKPWQRGIEIGMAHGYFVVGPFISLGPLRNTPEAATVGLLAGVALIGIFSVGGLLFGATMKPTLFDKPGDKPSAGYTELVNWHALGGVGGAGFAHALITIFGS